MEALIINVWNHYICELGSIIYGNYIYATLELVLMRIWKQYLWAFESRTYGNLETPYGSLEVILMELGRSNCRSFTGVIMDIWKHYLCRFGKSHYGSHYAVLMPVRTQYLQEFGSMNGVLLGRGV